MRCDCGKTLKNYRGLVQHWHRGCPRAILDLFLGGRSISELAEKFDKPGERIEGIIRRAMIESKLKGFQPEPMKHSNRKEKS